jgi:hypothetical protein
MGANHSLPDNAAVIPKPEGYDEAAAGFDFPSVGLEIEERGIIKKVVASKLVRDLVKPAELESCTNNFKQFLSFTVRSDVLSTTRSTRL